MFYCYIEDQSILLRKHTSGQSDTDSMIVVYDSKVIPDYEFN